MSKYYIYRIINIINNAAKDGINLIALPELCVTGYTCSDLFLQSHLLKNAENDTPQEEPTFVTYWKAAGELYDIVVESDEYYRRKQTWRRCGIPLCSGKRG